MNSTTFETPDEAREGLLERGVSEDAADAYLDVARGCAEALVDEYDVEGVDVDEVADWLAVGYVELAADYIDGGVWTGDEDVRDITDEIRTNPVENSALAVGKTSRRSEDMMRLAAAAHQSRLTG